MENPSLEVVIKNLSVTGRLSGITIYQKPDGRWQVSAKRVRSEGWRVCTGVNLYDTLMDALGPDYGHGWDELLQETPDDVLDLI